MTNTEKLRSVNEMCKETVKRLYKEMEDLGATVRDEAGALIPSPKTDQDKIMFLAGQVSLALFIQGATSSL